MKPGRLRFRDHDILAQRSLAPLSRAVAALGWGPSDRHAPRRPRMTIQARLLCVIAVSGFAALAATAPAQALTTQECSAKYQAAKTAGTLNGQKWNDFRKAQCGIWTDVLQISIRRDRLERQNIALRRRDDAGDALRSSSEPVSYTH